MDFTFTDEQQMLQDTTRRFVARDLSFDTRRRALTMEPGFSRAAWRGMAELGLLALQIPEQDGGLGGDAVDLMLVMQALGEGLVLEPYLASAVLGSKAIALCGNQQQRSQYLPALMAGDLLAVLAHDEAGSRFEPLRIQTRAERNADGFVLSGHKSVIAHAGAAELLLVTAQLGAGPALGIFVVTADAAGLQLQRYRTVDGIASADLDLRQVQLAPDALLGATQQTGNDPHPAGAGIPDLAGDQRAALQCILDYGLAALCAEAVGALDKVLAATVEYTRTRRQFGAPIASFQALQHRMADMVLHIEQARSMSYLAAIHCSESDAAARARALSAAKVVVGQACRFVGQQAVQLHGGMGVTDELPLGHYFKRLMAIELQCGSSDWHLQRYAAQL